MNKKTHDAYTRIAKVRCARSERELADVAQLALRAEQALDDHRALTRVHGEDVHGALRQGGSPALLALDFHHRLRAQTQDAFLQHALTTQLDALKQARSARDKSERLRKSAEKMGEQLKATRQGAFTRRAQDEQDELVTRSSYARLAG